MSEDKKDEFTVTLPPGQVARVPSVKLAGRSEWNEYFLRIAKEVASRSTCLRIPEGVGALLVRNRHILATGYAGSIKGLPHCTDAGVGCLMDEKTGGCVRTVHAEINAILQAAQHGVSIKDTTLYSTMSPCWDCFKALINGGITKIIYETEYRIVDRQKKFADDLRLPFIHIGDKKYVPKAVKKPESSEWTDAEAKSFIDWSDSQAPNWKPCVQGCGPDDHGCPHK